MFVLVAKMYMYAWYGGKEIIFDPKTGSHRLDLELHHAPPPCCSTQLRQIGAAQHEPHWMRSAGVRPGHARINPTY